MGLFHAPQVNIRKHPLGNALMRFVVALAFCLTVAGCNGLNKTYSKPSHPEHINISIRTDDENVSQIALYRAQGHIVKEVKEANKFQSVNADIEGILISVMVSTYGESEEHKGSEYVKTALQLAAIGAAAYGGWILIPGSQENLHIKATMTITRGPELLATYDIGNQFLGTNKNGVEKRLINAVVKAALEI